MDHRMLSRRSFIGVAGAFALAGLAGCGSSGSASSASASSASASASASAAASGGAKDTLTIYVGAEPDNGFDPMTGYGSSGAYTFFHSRLLRFDKDMQLQPDLAKKWDVSDDGLPVLASPLASARVTTKPRARQPRLTTSRCPEARKLQKASFCPLW